MEPCYFGPVVWANPSNCSCPGVVLNFDPGFPLFPPVCIPSELFLGHRISAVRVITHICFDRTFYYFSLISFFFHRRFQINIFLWQESLELKLLQFSHVIRVPVSTQVCNSYVKPDTKHQSHLFSTFFWENALPYLEARNDAATGLYCESNAKCRATLTVDCPLSSHHAHDQLFPSCSCLTQLALCSCQNHLMPNLSLLRVRENHLPFLQGFERWRWFTVWYRISLILSHVLGWGS